MSTSAGPFEPFFLRQGYVVLDGGLASELERLGHDLNDPLWSARVLLEDSEAIAVVHRNFLEMGADCIGTATYQASFEGLRARGLSDSEATGFFQRAVDIAVQSRDEFWGDPTNRIDRLKPLVAASLGPYGAFLADGSEYQGDYGLSAAAIHAFHEDRWRVILESKADVTAWETIPSRLEAQVLGELLSEARGVHAWVSFSCRDGERLCDGTPVSEVVRELDDIPNLVAVGINCTAPEYITSLLCRMRTATDKPLFVYPNRGGRYDAEAKVWEAPPVDIPWRKLISEWRENGVFGVGGCCRVGSAEIRMIRHALEVG